MFEDPTAPKRCTSILSFDCEIYTVTLPKLILSTQTSFMSHDNFKQNLT
jgi:hypothetical protein